MANPLYVAQCGRLNGRTWMRIDGHGFLTSDAGKSITVIGVAERTMNGTFKISKFTPPDHLEYLQPGLHDVQPIGGGAVAIT